MSSHVHIDRGSDGSAVACKRPTSADGAPRIRAEGLRLAEIDHPGVVRLVEVRDDENGPVLVTDYVGPRTMATIGPVSSERAARLVGDLATTVADLHALGLVHGAVAPEHVLISGDRTVLCGLAPEPSKLSRADDVYGIGVILQTLLEHELEEEPIPDHRPWRRTPWLGYRHRALLTLADQATDDDPRRRPAARALADSVGSLGGTAPERPTVNSRDGISVAQSLVDLIAVHLPRRGGRTGTRRSRPSLARLVVFATLGLLATGAGIGGIAGAARPSGTAPAAVASAPGSCHTAHGLSADLDGDGCREEVRFGPGWVAVEGERFRVGRPGNALAVGDWDCDGRATIALLQKASGTVWQFDSWNPDTPVTAERVGRYAGAIDLRTQAGPDCDRLIVRRRDGSSTEVPRA